MLNRPRVVSSCKHTYMDQKKAPPCTSIDVNLKTLCHAVAKAILTGCPLLTPEDRKTYSRGNQLMLSRL